MKIIKISKPVLLLIFLIALGTLAGYFLFRPGTIALDFGLLGFLVGALVAYWFFTFGLAQMLINNDLTMNDKGEIVNIKKSEDRQSR